MSAVVGWEKRDCSISCCWPGKEGQLYQLLLAWKRVTAIPRQLLLAGKRGTAISAVAGWEKRDGYTQAAVAGWEKRDCSISCCWLGK